MATSVTINPINQFFDQPSGLPLNNGQIYIGEVNKDPEQFPITVYWDEAGTVPAVQPIRTTSGYPTRNGSPAILYVNSTYSLRVRNEGDVQVFYSPVTGTLPVIPPTAFIDTELVPSFASANSFTVTGNQTSVFLPGGLANLRLQMTLGGGFVYGTVVSAVFGALTTVTLTMDSTPLDASLSAVAASFLKPSPNAVPESAIGAAIRVAATQAAAQQALGTVSVRQTVLSGPVDVNGLAAFVGATGSTTVTATGTLKATAAAGGDANCTGSIVNPSWTGLSTNGTMYLFLDITSDGVVTTGSTTLAPTYRWGGADVTTNLQNTFNIQEMTMKAGNGATATQVFRVFVGEVTIAGAVVTAIIWYALMGRFTSATTATLPGTSTAVSSNHNIGVIPKVRRLVLVNITAQGGYTTGQETSQVVTLATASVSWPLIPSAERLTMRFATSEGVAFEGVPFGGGARFSLTAANWSYRFEAERGW